MQDILIERCTLRVVRRGGWSWGADPRRLLRNVLDSVPALVASRLAELLADVPGDGAITQPIQIRIPIRLDEIRAHSRLEAATVTGSPPRWRAQIDDALRKAVDGVEITRPPQDRRDDAVLPPAVETERLADVLREALIAWSRSGMLPFLLAAASEEAAERWLRALAVGAFMGENAPSHGDDGGAAHAEHQSISTRGRAEMTARAQLETIARQLASTPGATSTPVIDIDGVSHVPRESRPPDPGITSFAHADAPPVDSPALDTLGRADSSAPRRGVVAPPVAASREPLVDAEVRVPSALPWLLLVPLHRIGYLRMLRVALEAAAVERYAAVFGAAIAYKLAGSADRAWQKSGEAEQIAMVMAAQRNPISKPELHRFAHRLAPHCPLLDAQVAHAITGGKPAGDPWLLQMVRNDSAPLFALIDPEGLFPAWWAVEAERGVDALRTSGGAEVIVAEEAADPRLLERLSGAGIRFVTTSRPGRGESWVRIHASGSHAWWSNTPGAVTPDTRRRMTSIDQLVSRADALVEEFCGRRLALPLDPASALERTLSLAVTVALGTIAWKLWHTRESTDPLLALSRLADLDARVRFTRRSVRVVVPLGRRHRDLYDAGLLTDVRDVPWLDGRTLEFSGG